MWNHIFRYEKIELLICIYEISRELIFKYGISGCSRCLTLVTTVNPVLFQVQLRQLFPSQLNNVSPCKCQFTSCLWMVCLFCRAVYLGLYMCCNREHSNIFWYNISGGATIFWNWLHWPSQYRHFPCDRILS